MFGRGVLGIGGLDWGRGLLGGLLNKDCGGALSKIFFFIILLFLK